ncbi:hypothetical protein [Halomontanus rarus]|uniref:hypothetical protein n=1 Tax=Halomontanus rarus TaxID=3034020 RepID=UPI001A99D1B0
MRSGPSSPSNSPSRSPRATHSRSGPGRTNRPLGISIICALGVLGFFLTFLPILEIASFGGGAGFIALVLLVFNFGHLVILVGLWNMNSSILPWAYLFYGLGLLFDLVTLSLGGMIISLVILGYLLSVADTFD